MNIIASINEMQTTARSLKREGKTITFVPTMGFLHEGHASLLREGRKRGDILVLSLFVNPIQFGRNEDLDRYPRDAERDCRIGRQMWSGHCPSRLMRRGCIPVDSKPPSLLVSCQSRYAEQAVRDILTVSRQWLPNYST